MCRSQLSLEEVVVLGGNDCRETDVLFKKAFFEDEGGRGCFKYLLFFSSREEKE